MSGELAQHVWPKTIWHRGLIGLAGLIIWLTALDFPYAVSDQLDPSWQAALVDAHLHDRQFGRDIIFTAGPLGWLTAYAYLPDALNAKIVWELVAKLCCAVVVVLVSVRLPPVRRWFLLLGVPLSNGLFPDTLFALVITLVILVWLFEPRTPLAAVVAFLIGLAALAHVKFTFTLLATAGVLLAASSLVWRGNTKRASVLVGGGLLAYLVGWMAAGQHLGHLPDHLFYSWKIASGYAEAMAFDETWPVFLAGLGVFVGGASVCWQMVRNPTDRRLVWPASAFLAAAWYLNWKHGFTRADGHVLNFFVFALWLAPLLPPLFFPGRRLMLSDGIVVLAIVGIGLFDHQIFARAMPLTAARLRSGANLMLRPALLKENFAAAWEAEKKSADLPAVRTTVGDATIDFLTYRLGAAFLNDFNYHPRPIPQSYSAYVSSLEKANLRFFQSEGAPEFVLFRHGTIDSRFPSLDDALVLAELPRGYDLIEATNSHALLQRRATRPPQFEAARSLMLDRPASLGEEIPLPLERTHALWARVRFRPSRIGVGRSVLFKPPQIHIVVTDGNGRQSRHRIVRAVAEEGFVLQPFLETQDDVNQFFASKGRKWLRSVRFEPARSDEAEFWRGLQFTLFRLDDMPLETLDPMGGYVDTGFTNLSPIRVFSTLAVEPLEIERRPALMLHVEGVISFALDDRRCLDGFCGIREGAYTNGALNSGADFSAEVEYADGRRETIWNRRLQPLTIPEERGSQPFHLAIPPDAVRLHLHTKPGPDDSASWDWTYWSELQFSVCPAP